jgi:hypothetical protein
MVKSEVDSTPTRIDNSAVRFVKRVELPVIPKAGTVLDLTGAAMSAPFRCTVRQADWDERESIFVVACRYTKPSIAEADYRALLGSSDWVAKPLL